MRSDEVGSGIEQDKVLQPASQSTTSQPYHVLSTSQPSHSRCLRITRWSPFIKSGFDETPLVSTSCIAAGARGPHGGVLEDPRRGGLVQGCHCVRAGLGHRHRCHRNPCTGAYRLLVLGVTHPVPCVERPTTHLCFLLHLDAAVIWRSGYHLYTPVVSSFCRFLVRSVRSSGQSIALRFCFSLVRFDSIRFDSIRFDSIRFDGRRKSLP